MIDATTAKVVTAASIAASGGGVFLATDSIAVTSVWVLGTLAGAGGVIAFLFRALIVAKDNEKKLLLEQKDAAIKELESKQKSYEEVANEAIKSAIETANFYRAKDGKPPIIPTAPVVSESHSPSTPEQRETARIATLRATMALIKLTMDQPPRPEPERAMKEVKK